MISRLLSTTTWLALLAAPVALLAQNVATSANEDERIEALLREQSEFYRPKSTLAVGFRLLTSGAQTHFGKLGTVPSNLTVAPASEGAVTRQYNNGNVTLDAARPNEVDINGIQTSVPGGRYTTSGQKTVDVLDANGVVIGSTTSTVQTGDYVSFTPGLTRSWGYVNAQQAALKPGYIAMSTYSASSDGGFADHKMGSSGGIELSLYQRVGKGTRRFEWSVLAGVSLNGINNKTSGSVVSTLTANTDFYSLNGKTAPGLPTTTTTDANGQSTVTINPYSSTADFVNLVDTAGNIVTVNGVEKATPIGVIPEGPTQTTTSKTNVNGNWQVKGAYFMMRVGPSLHAQLSERLGLSASLGLAGAYAGTTYTANENFTIPDSNGALIVKAESSTAKHFLGGYFADLNMDWSANEFVALFGGVSAQQFGDYEQLVGARTARIDLGGSVGLRGGITIKF